MNDRDARLADRLQACLDDRRDPLDDDELCAWLADDAARLDEFVRMRALLRTLPGMPARHRRPWLYVGLAAAALTAVALLWWQRPAPRTRILAAGFTETSPRAGLAIEVTTWRRLVATQSIRLTTFERRSIRP